MDIKSLLDSLTHAIVAGIGDDANAPDSVCVRVVAANLIAHRLV